MNGKGGALHDLSRAIGALEAGIAALSKIVDEERNAAAHHRNALRETIAALAESVRTLAHDVAAMKPTVKETQEKLLEARGRAKLGSALMALWMTISGVTAAAVTWVLSHWK